MTVSEWADENRYLSPEDSFEKGKWRTDRAEYQRGIMDAFSEPGVTDIVGMTSAQVGKTQMLNNVIGRQIHLDPVPILFVHSNETLAEDWSEDRFTPMLRDCPVLRGRIKSPLARDGGNRKLHKRFPGGYISIAGANAPSALAGRPIGLVLGDEIDRWPGNVGKEGDPWNLAKARTKTFPNAKRAAFSTPTTKVRSRIYRLWKNSDQRRFNVPCSACGVDQVLQWSGVVWDKDDDGNHLSSTARYECEHCDAQWDDATRWRQVRDGQWQATAPFNGTAGFHLNEIYSPFVKLADMVQEFLDSKDDPETLQTFVNTALGEPYGEPTDEVDADPLYERREEYPAQVPADALILTAGIDTQDDRLEVEVVGWGKHEESWSIDYGILWGDTSRPEVWNELTEFLEQTYEHENGHQMAITRRCLDTAGHRTSEAYAYCKGRSHPRAYAIIGRGGEDRPIISAPTKKRLGRDKVPVLLYTVGVDGLKRRLYRRLKLEEPGPGYCHWPLTQPYSEEYFAQLTAEAETTKWRKGQPYLEWVAKRKRNEALDCRVYAMAALAIRKVQWSVLEKRLAKQGEETEKQAPKPKKKRVRPRRASWKDSWK